MPRKLGGQVQSWSGPRVSQHQWIFILSESFRAASSFQTGSSLLAPGLPGALAFIRLLPTLSPFKYNHIGIRLLFTQGIRLATDFNSKLGVSIIPWYFEYKLRSFFFFFLMFIESCRFTWKVRQISTVCILSSSQITKESWKAPMNSFWGKKSVFFLCFLWVMSNIFGD